MPVSIVVGGQFGSEGKGKVALDLVRRESDRSRTVIRVGGPNSGHTGYTRSGQRLALRQLPAASIDNDVDVVFPAGSYLEPELLEEELKLTGFPRHRIFIHPDANIITEKHKEWEAESALVTSIGSTGSGVGAAVMSSVARHTDKFPVSSVFAKDIMSMAKYLRDTTLLLRQKLTNEERVVIEGSQGFGLSLLDGGHWPKATSRSTTASAALSEAGLSPLDVDSIYLVVRSYPIRVAGDSGPLRKETTWDAIAKRCGREILEEYTTVTNKLRRVGEFDPEIVRRAIAANNPTHIVLNHVDYLKDISQGIQRISDSLEVDISYIGRDPYRMEDYVSSLVV